MTLDRLARCAVLAYPRAYRDRFGGDLEETITARLQDAAARRGLAGVVLIAYHFADAIGSGVIEQLRALHVRAFWPRHVQTHHPRRNIAMTFETIASDMRLAFRQLRSAPGLACAVIATLALGIGANSAIFSVVHAVLLRPLPYADPDALVMVWSHNLKQGDPNNSVSPADFEAYRAAPALSGVEGMYAFLVPVPVRAGGEPDTVQAATLSTGMFALLGRTPLLGRLWKPGDADPGVVLGYDYWQRHFGSDPNVIGRAVSIGSPEQPTTIAAVMPADFAFPYRSMLGASGFTRSPQPDIWLPLVPAADPRYLDQMGQPNRIVHYLAVIGRLKPGVSADRVRADLESIASSRAGQYADTNSGWGVTVRPLHEQAVGRVRPALLVVFAGVGLVLLITCLNVANVLLARATARQRDMAVRVALGAPRYRLIQQMLVESLLLACAGGVAGMGLTWWGTRVLAAVGPPSLPRLNEIAPDGVVVAFVIAATLATGLATGLLPALFAMRAPAIGDGRRTTGSRARRRVRAALVIGEVAMAMMLTIGAGLLLHSFVRVLDVDPGFEPDGLLTLQMSVPARYGNAAARVTSYDELEARLKALPGVVGVGGTTRLPLGSTSVSTVLEVDGRTVPTAQMPEVEMRRAVFDYFKTMGIPLMRGRTFEPDDRIGAPSVAVVNTVLVNRVFPNEDPVGRRVKIGAGATTWTTIVGVIGSVRHASLEEAPRPEIYLSYRQGPPSGPFLAIRTAGDPAALAVAVRGAIRDSGADAPIDVRPMEQVRSTAVAERRFVVLLVGLFGALALMLAAIGVYGIITLLADERATEIAIRLALGSAPVQVFTLVMSDTLRLTATGVLVGAAAGLALTPALASQLFGISPADPLTYATVTLTLIGIACLAAFVPARRAMRIDPAVALRR